MKKHTRKDRLKNECTHRQYFGQFVNQSIIDRVSSRVKSWGFDNPAAALYADVKMYWDHLPMPFGAPERMREAGDVNANTLCNAVCLNKEAYRQYLDAEGIKIVSMELTQHDARKISSVWKEKINGKDVLVPPKGDID